MRIWHRLLVGLLAIAGLVMLVVCVSISLSLQIGKLRDIELPMEQNLRKVEVSVWEAIHAANAFRSTGKPYYAELYEEKVNDVDAYFAKHVRLIDTPTEVKLAAEFESYWRQAKAEGRHLLETVRREQLAESEFFSFVNQADSTIDDKIQAVMSQHDPNVLEKEQALREVEVSIWEAIYAGKQYTGLTPKIEKAGYPENSFADRMQQQFREVNDFWLKYKAMATSDGQSSGIREFEDSWRQAVHAGNEVVALQDQSSRVYSNFYKYVNLVDDVIDVKMQHDTQTRIADKDESASRATAVTIAIGLVAVIAAVVICSIIARSISTPIRDLMFAASEFGKGNFDYRAASQRKDELGELSRALDCMGDKLKSSSDRIRNEVAERQRAEALMQETRDYLEAALEQSPSGIVIADAPDGKIRFVNQSAVDIRGGDYGELSDIDMTKYSIEWQTYHADGSLYPTEQLPLSVAMLHGQTVRNEELIIRDKDGNDHWVNANAAPIRDADGKITAGIVIFDDVTDRRRLMDEMQTLAFRDSLTGLPNRTSILESIQHAIDRGDDNRFALVFLDFDRFKLINDSLGHDVGDELLKQIAARLAKVLRSTDEVMIPARLGGDEFVILLDNLASSKDATAVAERLLQALAPGYTLGGQTVYSTASIGVVTSDHRFDSASDMLRDADLAMYKSKAEGKARYTVFDKILREKVQARLQLESEMRNGIPRDEFVLAYQPIISLETGEIEGVEALLRWKHPERGMTGADEFIAVAEETGMIIPLGNRIINDACRQLAQWHRKWHVTERPLRLHVNISRTQLFLPSLIQVVELALVEHELPAECLHLEVAESVIMEDPKTAIATLEKLRQLDVKINIDDFGTGYSSLSCIHEFPIDVLKIDRAFIAKLKETPDLAALLNAVVTLADHLGLPVVAEGIEDMDQVAMLRALGCDYGQGYLFAKPLPAEELERLLGTVFKMTPNASEPLSTIHS